MEYFNGALRRAGIAATCGPALYRGLKDGLTYGLSVGTSGDLNGSSGRAVRDYRERVRKEKNPVRFFDRLGWNVATTFTSGRPR